ncbi:MAG: hypothetical protein JWR26_3784 [Pedosphaera sp.]|nr:hypothetical protein [Pedosphaera sp.]
MIILSSDELDILAYLKAARGSSVSMGEICRSAGGRRRFKDSPHWAKGVMSRLVDSKMVEVNERGHYRFLTDDPNKQEEPPGVIGEDYLPETKTEASPIIGEDYFPAPSNETDANPGRWFSPEIESILKKSGKKFGK